MEKGTLLAALSGMLLPLVTCQGATLTKEFNRCMDKSGGVTIEMHDCLDAEHGRQDRRLNMDYQALMAGMAPPEKIRLRQSERQWLTHRKSKCAHAGDAHAGGTLQGIEIHSCFVNETADRADVLERLLKTGH